MRSSLLSLIVCGLFSYCVGFITSELFGPNAIRSERRIALLEEQIVLLDRERSRLDTAADNQRVAYDGLKIQYDDVMVMNSRVVSENHKLRRALDHLTIKEELPQPRRIIGAGDIVVTRQSNWAPGYRVIAVDGDYAFVQDLADKQSRSCLLLISLELKKLNN